MMIEIAKSDVIAEIENLLRRAGRTEWALYVREDGDLAVRHNTYPKNGWYELMDADCLAEYDDGDGRYPGDDGYAYAETAEWIVESTVFENAEIYDDESMNFKPVIFNIS